MTRKRRISTRSLFTLSAAAILSLACLASTQATVRGGVDVATKRLLASQTYSSDYSSKQEAMEAGLAINEQIAEEGMVLLKNERNTLPLTTRSGSEATRVTLFGYASYAPQGGAEGGGDSSAGTVHLTSDIYSSLRSAGYVTNPAIRAFYEEKTAEGAAQATPTTPTDFTTVDELIKDTSITGTYNNYGDAAIVVFSIGNVADTSIQHKYQLDSKQMALLKHAEDNFDKVIVLINNSVPVEIGALKDDDKVDAILVVGQPGDNGFDAVGKILNGEVNPSGRLVDTYARDLTSAPSYNNYSAGVKKADPNNPDLTGGTGDYLKYLVDGKEVNTYISVYEEGIYVGYRYYETVAAIDGNDTWYDQTVAYPFGYGLSYTNFNYEVTPRPTASTTIHADDTLTFDIKVTNTGDVAGKDVVQLYYSAPYTVGGLEKATIALGDFTKTDLLAPGESQTVTVHVDVRDLASYDYKTEKTYVLDAGDYEFTVRSNVHADPVDTVSYTVATKAVIDESRSGTEVTNRFDDLNTWMDENDENLSREDFASKTAEQRKQLTTKPTDAERTLTAEEYKAWNGDIDSAEDDTNKPWSIPAGTKLEYADPATRPATAEVTLDQLIGKDYDDPLWDDLISQLTLEEMTNLINHGGFKTISLDYIGKPYSLDTDGPKGWTGNGTAGSKLNAYAAEPVIASTWNKELAYEMGRNVADQGLWGSSDRNDLDVGGKISGYTGWYAPAMNIHRSPFDGRYTEYYSEDPVLTGMMASNASLGAKSKGAYVFIKHFALHDDGAGVAGSYNHETQSYQISGYRGSVEKESGLSVWCNEQAMREIYLKPFQMAVEIGGATAAMSAFNRFGTTWAGGCYALLTEILRNEWGFRGFVVTDISIYGFLNVDQMIRAGGDAVLDSGSSLTLGATEYTASNPDTQIYYMQQAAHNILYTVANSNAMQLPLGASVYYAAPTSPLADATVGEAFTGDIGSAELNTMHNYVDPSTITYAVTDGVLPAGLTFNADGTITGTPTVAGSYDFTVTASAEGYASGSRSFTIHVKEAAVEVEEPKDYDQDIADINTALDDLDGKIDAIPGQGLAIGALIVGIIGIVTGAAAIVLHFFKKN